MINVVYGHISSNQIDETLPNFIKTKHSIEGGRKKNIRKGPTLGLENRQCQLGGQVGGMGKGQVLKPPPPRASQKAC